MEILSWSHRASSNALFKSRTTRAALPSAIMPTGITATMTPASASAKTESRHTPFLVFLIFRRNLSFGPISVFHSSLSSLKNRFPLPLPEIGFDWTLKGPMRLKRGRTHHILKKTKETLSNPIPGECARIRGFVNVRSNEQQPEPELKAPADPRDPQQAR
jgi:hypothetical protein